MNYIRLGIIGFGVQGKAYANKIIDPKNELDNIKITAISTSDSSKTDYLKEYCEFEVFKGWKEMILSGKVDAIVTTVPHFLHKEICVFALDNKIHVLGEKPAGIAAKNVRLINEAANRNPEITYALFFNQRTNKLYKRLKEIVDNKELGELYRFNWIINNWWRTDKYFEQSEWRGTWGSEGGGVLVNQAPHQLDLWQWITGMPTKVTSKILYGKDRNISVDNDVTVMCEYENGATGTFITSTHDPIGTDRLELTFSKGKIVVDNSKVATIYKFTENEIDLNKNLTLEEVSIQSKKFKDTDSNDLFTKEILDFGGNPLQHVIILKNFANNILNGEKLIANGTEGINEVNLANAIYLSDFIGKEVNIPVDEDLFIKELNKKIEAEGKYPTIK